MAKYTTELRSICEVKAGLKESVGFSQIDSVIASSWNKIFTTTAPLFDESYRQTLFSKIIKHYYMQEIAYETVGQWLYRVNTKMEEILPYYNKIYTAVQQDYNILTDTDYTDTGNSTGNRNENVKTEGSRNNIRTDNLKAKTTNDLLDTTTNDLVQTQTNNLTRENTGESTNTSNDNYQETPQGDLSMVSELNYLTNARRITDNGNSSNTETNTGDVTTDNTGTQEIEHTGTSTLDNTGTQSNDETFGDKRTGNYNSTDEYVHHIVGKRGGMTYPAMIEDYISKLKNVDMLVIQEFKGEFMQIW